MKQYAGLYGTDIAFTSSVEFAKGVAITITDEDGVTLSSLYTDHLRTGPVANPITTDATTGEYAFYAEPGPHVLKGSGGFQATVLVPNWKDEPPNPGQVTPAMLSFDPATQVELDAEAAARAAAVSGEAATRAAADALLIPLAQRAAANGVATLDGSSLIPDAQIPPAITRDSELSAAIAALVNASPATLDTLKELADALGDDPNFATTMTTALAARVLKAGDTSTGEQVAPSFKASGKTGATATPVILGGGTASGAPTTGAHLKGELVPDDAGDIWRCTVAGTPGTWIKVGSGTFVSLGGTVMVDAPSGGDDSAMVQAAITAAGSSNELQFRRGTYRINNLTQTVSARWKCAGRKATTFLKNANGPMVTITGSACEIDECTFQGAGATFTGEGIVVDTGGDDFSLGPNTGIVDMDSYTVKFASNAAGLRSHLRGQHTRHDPTQPAILFPPNEANGDRHLEHIDCAGGVLADFAGCSTTHVIGCNTTNVVFGANSKKVNMVGGRIASAGGLTTILGRDHIIDVICAGSLVLDATSQDCSVRGEYVLGVTDNGTRNIVLASQGATLSPLLEVSGRQLGLANDFPKTIDPRLLSAASTLNANQAVYLRSTGTGPVSKIGVHVNVQSGNVCAGAYSNNGSVGSLARPAARKATSGSVACPAAGYAEISLGGSVTVVEGDWFAIEADNATASFYRASTAGFGSALAAGLSHFQSAAFPLPDPAVPSATGSIFSVLMVGVA